MIVNGLAIGIPVLVLLAGIGIVVLLLRRDDGRHAADPLFAVPEVHHDEYALDTRPLMANLRHKYGDYGDDGPAPFEKELQAPAAAVEPPSPQAVLPPPPVSPLDAARAAVDAVRAMPTGDYLGHLEGATTWEQRGPFTDWLSPDTWGRGFPAIRLTGDSDGDMDAPLCMPLEVHREPEGV